MTDLGGRIRAARTRIGITQQALADAVGLHQSEISRIERGERDIAVRVLARIATALGRRAEDLMTDEAA